MARLVLVPCRTESRSSIEERLEDEIDLIDRLNSFQKLLKNKKTYISQVLGCSVNDNGSFSVRAAKWEALHPSFL
jgi:hypothetical protein